MSLRESALVDEEKRRVRSEWVRVENSLTPLLKQSYVLMKPFFSSQFIARLAFALVNESLRKERLKKILMCLAFIFIFLILRDFLFNQSSQINRTRDLFNF